MKIEKIEEKIFTLSEEECNLLHEQIEEFNFTDKSAILLHKFWCGLIE